MNITRVPVNSFATYEIAAAGDVLTVNGVAWDFSQLAEGDVLPQEAVRDASGAVAPWLTSAVTRTGGVITLSVIEPDTPLAPPVADAAPATEWTKRTTQAGRDAAAAAAKAAATLPAIRDEMLDAVAAGRAIPPELRARWEAARQSARGRTEDGRPLVGNEP